MTTTPDLHAAAAESDPFSDDILADPLPFQAALRDAGRVVHLREYDVYAMGRYADVHLALRDWQTFESGAGVGLSNFRTEKPWRPPSLLLEADPPRHDAPRETLERVLGARRIRAMAGAWKETAEQLVDEVLDRGVEFDAAADLAAVYPLRVFPDAVGIGDAGREHLLPYGDHAFNAFGPGNHHVAKGLDRIGEHGAWVGEQCARDSLAPSGFGADIWAATDAGDISADQAPLMVRSLLTAGVDTTVHAIAALLYALSTHPEAYRRLRQHPELVRTAFDEAIRWESPVQTFFRTATRDVLLDDVTVPAGSKILMFLGSANRDPRRWDDPDEYSLDRDPSAHVGFGMGIHQCVGQHVARLEAVSLLEALLARVETIEIAGGPVRHLNNTLRAWESIPVRVVRV